jgi:hypothetical protein
MKIGEIYNQIISEETDNLFYHGSPYQFDRFDTDKIGSGDGLAKFGHGFYFADNKETAIYYAKELSIGDNRKNGFNLYTVRLLNLNEFYNWEEETPHHIAECIVRKLQKIGKHDNAELIVNEFNEYGNYWPLKSMYEILTDMLGNSKLTSEWLTICGVGGVIGESPAHNGLVYTVYDDSSIKILNVEKI